MITQRIDPSQLQLKDTVVSINRVTKVVKGGKNLSFSVAVAGVACWAAGLGAQDATLRAGIAQVVSMSRRGTAFGIFNGVFGVSWFVGSAIMGVLYDHSKEALVLFGVAAQAAAAVLFFALRKRLAAAAAGH